MDFVETLLKRRSIRRFRQEKVSHDALTLLIEAARVAPCAANRQKLRFVAINSPALVDKIFPLTRWGAKVSPRRNPVAGETSPTAFIAVCCEAENPDWLCGCDTGAAVENMLLRAVDLGLGCCWLGAFDHAEVDKLLFPQGGMHTLSLVAVGYPAETPELENSSSENILDYYLDENDVLHVPKLAAEKLATFIE